MANDKQIGQFFKDALKNLEQEPSNKVWKALEGSSVIKQAAWKMFVHSKMFIYGISGLAAAGIITYFGFFYESKTVKEAPPQQPSQQVIQPQQAKEDIIEIAPVVKSEAKVNETKATPAKATKSEQASAEVSENTIPDQKQAEQLSDPVNVNIVKKESKPVISTQTAKESPVESKKTKQAVKAPAPEKSSIGSDLHNNQVASPVTFSNPSVEFSPEQSICKGEKVTLWASGGASYHWNNGSVNDTVVVAPSNTTIYSVTVTTADADQHIGNVKVTVISCIPLYIPNAFTPNSDGHNDIFKVFGSGIEKFEIQIYSRRGDRIFESTSMEEGWDGTIKGSLAPVGVYMYVIRYTDENQHPNELSGQITLIR